MEKVAKMITIVVIDSGVDLGHDVFRGSSRISPFMEDHCISDSAGHGTAVCAILHKNAPNAQIKVAKLFNEALTSETEELVSLLEYIDAEVDCQIINMSIGVRNSDKKLYAVCERLCKKGIIIVAAFDNAGAVSYPAAYPFVVGVDSHPHCKATEYHFVEDSIVTLFAKGGFHRLAWVNTPYIISQGTSFAAPYVSAEIIKILEGGATPEEVIVKLKENAQLCYESKNKLEKPCLGLPMMIKKAAAFPYNKEMHSLLNYKDMLMFELVDIYDTKYSGLPGKTVSSINNKTHMIVKNVNEFDPSDIDTLILGHTIEIEKHIGESHVLELIQACLENNIQIYSFDNRIKEHLDGFNIAGIKVAWPSQNATIRTNYRFGKLYQLKTPVLSVFGTSSQQGKFTLQLELRRMFIEAGFKVAQFGTEPNSLLFGMNVVYPLGYGATIDYSGKEAVMAINEIMYHLDELECDIIITGAQSGTTPLLFDNVAQLTFNQIDQLVGVNPDAVVLCVNPHDELEYITRTIKAIEGLSLSEIVALCVYPMTYMNDWQMVSGKKVPVTPEKLSSIANAIMKKTGKEVYILGDESHMTALFDTCVRYFLSDETQVDE